MMLTRTLFITALLAATGCGDDGGDAAPDAGPAGCAVAPTLDTTIELDPTGPNTQIHGYVAFDGEAIWVAYNLADMEGTAGFDVFLTRLGCDGVALTAPTRVTTTLGGNDIDPALAIHSQTAAVVWTADNGTGVNNLDTLYRTYNADGTALMTADAILETNREGAAVPGNVTLPSVAAVDSTQFAIAAVRGLDASGTFQSFVQRVAFDGSLVGEAFDGYFESGITHATPTITVGPDGTLYVAWARSTTADDDVVVHGSVAPGGSVVAPSPPAEVITAQLGASPSYGFTDSQAVIAFHTPGPDRDIIVAEGDRLDGTARMIQFGATGELDHTPTMATAPGGGAVAYYRNISGFRNQVVVQGFKTDSSAGFTKGAEQVIPMAEAAPYAPAITHIQDDIYFVAWSQGPSPDFRLYGRFVSAP